jgi:protein-S-isoprenylcysteine O-methyltransferase Ste14
VGAERLGEWSVVGALACLAILGIGRGVMLRARGVRIFAIDRERTVSEGLADIGFVLSFLLWVYETLASALALGPHVVPAPTRALVLGAVTAKVLGVLAMSAGLIVYALALRALGASWRLGIDRDRPGPLVTGGIFARSRNPIYLGLTLLAAGVFLVLDRLILLLLAIVFAAYFQHLSRREERFLARHFGDAYRAYAERVGRWWTWRRYEGRCTDRQKSATDYTD